MILPPYHFVPKSVEDKTDFVLSPWYQSQLKYNIQEGLKTTQVPMFALYGDLDQSVDPEINAEILRKLSPNTTVKTLQGMNHLMQKANTGSPLEYLMLPESFDSEVVNLITTWINRL